MSKLKELLEGVEVEWKTLGDIVSTVTAPTKVKKEFYQKFGKLPIIDQGFEFIAAYTNEPFTPIRKDNYVVFGDHTEQIKYVDFAFIQGADGLKILRPKSDNAKYVYYAFVNFYRKELNYKRHWTTAKETLIPVPCPENPKKSLEIQKEIVRILDTFTERTETLINELATELEARKKQYNYYREKLLSFEEGQNSCLNQDLQDSQNFQDKVEWKTLGEITRVFSASRVHKNEWTTSGVPFYRTSDVISIFNGVKNSRDEAFISYQLYETLSLKSGKIQKDDILVTGGGTIGIPYIVPSDEPLYFKDADLLCIKKSEILNSKFLYHYFLSTKFRIYLDNIAHNATIAHYTISQITKTPVPVPPLEVQARIVAILDKFNTLTKSISEELPKEIALRKKQYEYYRDRLLTFK